MKAVALNRYLPISHPESLIDVELPAPVPGPRDLRVRVAAIAVNPVDTKVRAPRPSKADPDAPRVLGWDAAGVVDAVGAEVTLFAPGDEVYYAGDITRPGSNQQLQLVDERIAARKPRTLDFAEAAALPLTAITAYEALFDRLGFQIDGAGGSVLIIGGAGGVGSIAIQLAALAGLRVIATASRPDSRAWVASLGAKVVIDHRRDLRAELTAAGVGEVDAVLVCNDTDGYWPVLASLVRPQGRICSIVENKYPLDLDLLKSKSLTFVWELMFTRSMYRTPDMIEQHRLLTRVADWIDAGRLRTTLRERLGPISAATVRQAHHAIEAGTAIGKIAIEGWA